VIRITELPLPLDSDSLALRKAIVRRLKIDDADLLDSRSSSAATTRARKAVRSCSSTLSICGLATRPQSWRALHRNPTVRAAPDTSYHPVARAPAD